MFTIKIPGTAVLNDSPEVISSLFGSFHPWGGEKQRIIQLCLEAAVENSY